MQDGRVMATVSMLLGASTDLTPECLKGATQSDVKRMKQERQEAIKEAKRGLMTEKITEIVDETRQGPKIVEITDEEEQQLKIVELEEEEEAQDPKTVQLENDEVKEQQQEADSKAEVEAPKRPKRIPMETCVSEAEAKKVRGREGGGIWCCLNTCFIICTSLWKFSW